MEEKYRSRTFKIPAKWGEETSFAFLNFGLDAVEAIAELGEIRVLIYGAKADAMMSKITLKSGREYTVLGTIECVIRTLEMEP
jgi:hypothetical protein